VETKRFKVFVVDDHPSIAELLRILLGWQSDLEFCGQATSAREALKCTALVKPDIILLDLCLPDRHGLELIQDLDATDTEAKILVLSGYDEEFFAERALSAGARGYVMKSQPSDVWLKAMRLVATGSIYLSATMTSRLQRSLSRHRTGICVKRLERLSDRELEVLQLLSQGKSIGQISALLSLSARTVETYQTRLRVKLGVTTTHDLLRCAICWRVTNAMPTKCAAA